MPTYERPSFLATTEVVPDPKKGSRITSPGFELARINLAISFSGFCVGWSVFSGIDQKGTERIKVTFEFKQSVGDEPLKKRILSELPIRMRDKVGINMDFEAVPYSTIERFDYKTRRWTDERKEGLKQVKFIEK